MKRPPLSLDAPTRRVGLMMAMAIGLAGCAQMQQPDYYNKPKASSQTDAIAWAENADALQTIRPPMQIQFGLNTRQAGTNQPSSPQGSAQSSTESANSKLSANAGGITGGTPVGTPAPVASAQPVAPAGSAPTIPSSTGTPPSDAPPQIASGNTADSVQSASPPPSAQAQLMPEPQTFAGTLPCFHREMQCTAQRVTLTLAPNGRWRARSTYLEQNSQSGKPLTSQGCWKTVATRQPVIILLDMKGNVQAEMVMASNNVLRLRTLDGQAPNLTYNITRQPDLDPIDELNKAPVPACP